MNLHGIASPVIGAVNPYKPLRITQSTGYTTNAAGHRTPTTKIIDTTGQVQNTSARELQQLMGMGIEGDISMVWVVGNYGGVIRADRKGGDLFEIGGKCYLAVQVMESWPDWCRVAVCLQTRK